MCLEAKRNGFKYAKEDIICYKVLILDMPFKGKYQYITPCRFHTVSDEIVKGKKPFVASGKVCLTTGQFGDTCCINGGYIHTYITLNSALGYAMVVPHSYVFECIIPKGTRYIKGYCQDGAEGYASKKIKFIKEINS